MLIPDMPNAPPQNVPVMIAQANQAQPNDVKITRALGVCQPVPSNNYSLENTLSPIVAARIYLSSYEHQKNITSPATITVLQQPKHGILRLVTEADRGTILNSEGGPLKLDHGLYAYLPEQGYLGKDSATLLVDIGGIKVKVVFFFQGVEGPLGNTGEADLCSKTGTSWKISSTIDPNGTSTFASIEYHALTIGLTLHSRGTR